MKVAIITDTHFNFKKGNQIFHDYFEKFYSKVFFPTLEKLGIDTVIHLGDIFDNRRATDYWSIDWTKRVILEPLKKYKVQQEDTLSLLKRYVDESEIKLNKTRIKKLIQSIYQESFQM